VATGIELAELIDYRTATLKAGAGVYKKGWLADVEYTLTDFNNNNKSPVWYNPFRATDLGSKSAIGTNSNAYDRSRFSTGQLSLAPSNRPHDVSASGSVELPLHIRFTGSVSYGVTEQNDLLLPYTLNTGLAGINGAPMFLLEAVSLWGSQGSIRMTAMEPRPGSD